MNSFSGHITDIRTSDALSVVTVSVDAAVTFKAIVIDNPETAPYLSEGHAVHVLFKETEVVIATGKDPAVSLQNRVEGTISAIDKGLLLSRIVIHTPIGEVVSVISTNAVDALGLTENKNVIAMIKLNEVALAP